MFYSLTISTSQHRAQELRFQSEKRAQQVRQHFARSDPRFNPSPVTEAETDKKAVIVEPNNRSIYHDVSGLVFVGTAREASGSFDPQLDRAWFCHPDDVAEVRKEFERVRDRDALAEMPITSELLTGPRATNLKNLIKTAESEASENAAPVTNTRIELKYTSASAKGSLEVVVAGDISQRQVDAITRNLLDGYQIVAPQVGLPSPLEALVESGEIPGYDDTDHPLTDLPQWATGTPRAEDLHTSDPATHDVDIGQLAERLVVVAWQPMVETDRLGIPEDDLDEAFSPHF